MRQEELKEEPVMLKSDKCLNYKTGKGVLGYLTVREKLAMMDKLSEAIEVLYEMDKPEYDVVIKRQLRDGRRIFKRCIDNMESELDEIARRFGMKLEEEYVRRTANGSLYATYFIKDEYGIKRF